MFVGLLYSLQRERTISALKRRFILLQSEYPSILSAEIKSIPQFAQIKKHDLIIMDALYLVFHRYLHYLILLMQSRRLTLTDQEKPQDEMQQMMQSESDWIIVHSMEAQKERKNEVAEWKGRLVIFGVFLILAMLAYQILPPLAKRNPVAKFQNRYQTSLQVNSVKNGETENLDTPAIHPDQSKASVQLSNHQGLSVKYTTDDPTSQQPKVGQTNSVSQKAQAGKQTIIETQGQQAKVEETQGEVDKNSEEQIIPKVEDEIAHEEKEESRSELEINVEINSDPQKASKVEDDAAKVGDMEGSDAPKAVLEFPRVLWVQTDHELEIKAMEDALPAYNQIHFGSEDFQVRVVNNINAYDWLSDEMIAFVKETHQKSMVELPVYDLLRLALLYEHGGVFIRQNVLLMEGLAWVEKLMGGTVEGAALSCKRMGTEILLIHENKADGLWYRDDFFAARPKARLLKIIMDRTADIVKKGVWPYSKYRIGTINQDTQVSFFPWMTETLINVFNKQDSNICQNYGVQSFHEKDTVFMLTIVGNLASSIINLSQETFKAKYGKKYLLRMTMSHIADDIVQVIKTGDLSVGDSNSLLKNKLMMVEGNQWLTTPSRKTRDVHFCIVSLAPMKVDKYQKQMNVQLSYLAKQTFSQWNLVNFIQGFSDVSKKAGKKAVLVNASVYEGLNLQRAATKYCDPASVMLLLNYNETLQNQRDLEILAGHFQPIGVFAAFVNLKIGVKLHKPTGASRGDVKRKINKANQDVFNDVRNLMRAFSVQTYRFIASFDLFHSSTGRYFDREIPLVGVLELSERFSPCERGNLAYKARRLEELMAIPREKVFTNITIKAHQFKTPDITRFEYFAKFRQHDICDAIKFCQQNYAQVEKLVVFNNGKEGQPLSARKGKPELVPRKIHQIWIKGDIPNFKQYLMKRVREAHPDYQYFLWSHENFTRQNFPESYDLMQTLIEFDKKSPYSKMAMVADLARNEMLYYHGGFYLDTNYMLYGDRPLDQFLSFSLVSAGEVSPKQRVFKNQAFFSSPQHSTRLARIISHRIISSRNQYSRDAAKQTGPGLFAKIQLGQQEQDEDTFQPSFEEFYPNFLYDFPFDNVNKCITPSSTPDSQILFRSPKRSYLKNCTQIYNYALGMDFWDEGFTWSRRRW